MKKNLRRVVLGVLSLAFIFIITGCGSKKALTPSAFKSKMENKGYVVQDGTSQFAAYDYVKQVYIAQNSDAQYQIEFYELSDADTTTSFFENNKADFEISKGSSDVETAVTLGNYSKYTLSTGGQFKVVSRIDNTVVYLDVADTYEKTVKDVLKNLGY